MICANASDTFTLLHYNIKELDSVKILQGDKQLEYVKKIIQKYDSDLISLNEVQYDNLGIPSSDIKTTGKNLEKLAKLWSLNNRDFSFHPANTGKNAKQRSNGEYFIRPHTAEARAHADQVNFGVMPGQYSTGLISKLKIIDQKIISKLKWKDFNPKADFSEYKLANGEPIPNDIELFDKNFSDITVMVGDKKLHVILLHTVPAFGFGNKHSINIFRNAEQLRFLEWYLTGKTDFPVNLKINSLVQGESYIATGDFNVSISDKKEGAIVLNRLLANSSPWIAKDKMTFTNESSSFAPKPFRLMLDYIITSKDIETVEGEIIHPVFSREDPDCNKKKYVEYLNHIPVTYTQDGKPCKALIHEQYFMFKKASDHYPIWGKFRFKK